MQAKITDKSYLLYVNHISLPGERLHADLHGPTLASYGKHEYVLVIVDEASQYI